MPMGWVAAGTALTGLLASDASRSAGNTQADAAKRAGENQLSMFNTQQRNLSPWAGAGSSALSEEMRLLGLPLSPEQQQNQGSFDSAAYLAANPDVAAAKMDPWQHWQQYGRFEGRQFTGIQQPTNALGTGMLPTGLLTQSFTPQDFLAGKDPSFDFIKSQNMDAIKNAASTHGGVAGTGDSPISGNVMKAITDYSTGMASTEYGNAFNRWNSTLGNLFGRLQTLSGQGANTAGTTAGLGMGAAGAAGGFNTDAAAALAAGKVGSTNALTNAGSSIGNNYLMWQMMQQQQQQQQNPSIMSQPGSFDMNSMNLA